MNGAKTNEVKIWDVHGRKVQLALEGKSLIKTLTFSPDGERLASAGQDAGRIWDLRSVKEVGIVRGLQVTFGRNGHCLTAQGEGGMIVVRDQETGEEIRKVSGVEYILSPDGERLAVTNYGSGSGQITIWDVSTGERLSAFAGKLIDAVFSPDGRRLATVGAKSVVQVWDTDTGGELLRFKESKCNLMHLAFSPDGYRLGVVGTDGRSCFVKIWDGMPLEGKPAGR